jgi:dynein heavy chain
MLDALHISVFWLVGASWPTSLMVLQARGLIETWLSNVESHMRLTLKALAKKALKDYSASRRPAWALAQPAQLALLASSILWCQVGVCFCLRQHSPGARPLSV